MDKIFSEELIQLLKDNPMYWMIGAGVGAGLLLWVLIRRRRAYRVREGLPVLRGPLLDMLFGKSE